MMLDPFDENEAQPSDLLTPPLAQTGSLTPLHGAVLTITTTPGSIDSDDKVKSCAVVCLFPT